MKNDSEGTVAAASATEDSPAANNDFESKGMSQSIEGRETLDEQILPDTALSMQPPSLTSSQNAPPQDIAASGPSIDVGQQGCKTMNQTYAVT